MQKPIKIKNFRIKNLDRLTESELQSYSEILKYLKPKDKLGRYKARDLYEMEFAEVANLKKMFIEGNNLEAMKIFFGCPEWYLVRFRLIPFTHAQNYMNQQIELIIERENNVLSSEPDQKWIEAGIKRLDKFGPLNVLNRLGKEFCKSPEEIQTWSYGLVFSLMFLRSEESDIQENYAELTKNKK